MLVASCIPMVLSALVLGAHFLRSGRLLLVALCLAVPFVLFVRRVWALRLVQLFLLLGTAEWVRTLIEMVRVRQAQGEPFAAAGSQGDGDCDGKLVRGIGRKTGFQLKRLIFQRNRGPRAVFYKPANIKLHITLKP